MTPNHFSWQDLRRGDIYNVTLDDDGDFLDAQRFIPDGGIRPITYTQLSEVPQPHRAAIEGEIWRRQHGKK